jgi:hypothetical protein
MEKINSQKCSNNGHAAFSVSIYRKNGINICRNKILKINNYLFDTALTHMAKENIPLIMSTHKATPHQYPTVQHGDHQEPLLGRGASSCR